MGYKGEELSKIVEQYNKYKSTKTIDESLLDSNHKEIRKFFIDNYYAEKKQSDSNYKLDLELALKFYVFLNTKEDFLPKYESNYDFWRYVAVYDIPDVVADRYGIDNVDHFYRKAVRVYPYALYWYIHMSWQGNVEDTRNVLKDNTTDEILQVVERPSRIGINLSLYRKLMYEYSKIDKNKKMVDNGKKKYSLFRKVLTKNTSKIMIFRPELYPGGTNEYVNMLIKED